MYNLKTMLPTEIRHCPIGYYTGYDIPLKLSESAPTSYYDFVENEITIAAKQFDAYPDIKDEDIARTQCRSVVYHETGHSIFTPDWLFNGYYASLNKYKNIINVFEDEREETCGSAVFMDVNFRRLVYTVNGVKPGDKIDLSPGWPLFYAVTRFKVGPKELIDECSNIIKKFSYINRLDGTEYRPTYEYFEAIKTFWEHCGGTVPPEPSDDVPKGKIADPSKSTPPEGMPDKESHMKSDKIEASEDDTSIDKKSKHPMETELPEVEDPKEPDPDFKGEVLKSIKKSIGSASINENVTKLDQIFYKNSFRRKNKGGSLGYSGIFNVRNMIRPDHNFKIFDRQIGNSINRFSEINLVLWVDCSGSFKGAQKEMNKFLQALCIVERKYPWFSWQLITMDTVLHEHSRGDRHFIANGGNDVPPEVFDVYKRHQSTTKTNYNVVVFDGDALSDTYDYTGKNFAVWNHSNCIIVSDTDNAERINKYCGMAQKKIISRNYEKIFIEEVLKCMSSLIK